MEWVIPLLPVALAVFFLSALSYYHVERSGTLPDGVLQVVVVAVYDFFGFVPAFMLSLMVLVWSSIWFITGELERPWARCTRVLGFVLSLTLVVNIGAEHHSGWIGERLAVPLDQMFGGAISTLLAAIAALASLMLATDYLFYRYFDALARRGRTAPESDGVESAAVDELRTLEFAGASGVSGGSPPTYAGANDMSAAIADLEESVDGVADLDFESALPPSGESATAEQEGAGTVEALVAEEPGGSVDLPEFAYGELVGWRRRQAVREEAEAEEVGDEVRFSEEPERPRRRWESRYTHHDDDGEADEAEADEDEDEADEDEVLGYADDEPETAGSEELEAGGEEESVDDLEGGEELGCEDDEESEDEPGDDETLEYEDDDESDGEDVVERGIADDEDDEDDAGLLAFEDDELEDDELEDDELEDDELEADTLVRADESVDEADRESGEDAGVSEFTLLAGGAFDGPAADDGDDGWVEQSADELLELDPEPAAPRDPEEVDSEPVYEIPRPDRVPEPAVEPGVEPPSEEPGVEEPPVEEPVQRAAPGSHYQAQLFSTSAEDPGSVHAAADLVVESGRASVMFLQRRLRVGYDEALALLDALRVEGIVGGEMGDTQGPLLVDPEAWRSG